MTKQTHNGMRPSYQRRRRVRNSLRLERRERGLSRKQVARIIGTSVDTIDSYERGTRTPGLINALKLQLLYRSQVAAFYLPLYHELATAIREAEGRLPTRKVGRAA